MRVTAATLVLVALAATVGCLGGDEATPEPADAEEDGDEVAGGDGATANGTEPAAGGNATEPAIEEQEHAYVGPGAGPYAAGHGCWVGVDAPEDAGGVCVELPENTTELTLEAEDEVSPSVAGWINYRDADGGQVGSGEFFCDETTLEPPEEAQFVEVVVQGPGAGTVACIEGDVNAPVTGIVSATILHEPDTSNGT